MTELAAAAATSRLLVVIGHYFGGKPESLEAAWFSSQIEPLARIVAVNEFLVSLHRHFGPRRHGPDPNKRLAEDQTPERRLDIVILQVPGLGLLDRVGIDPSCYEVEYFNGPPMMLCFEAQRVLRERMGGYDYYAVIEDDMVFHDPLFIEKLALFQRTFGPDKLLQATNYEIARSGTPAMVSADPNLSAKNLAPFMRAGQANRLVMNWLGREQSFVRPMNPHARSYFLSDAQLRRWTATPWFYDKDASWLGPIESAMSLSIGRAFDLYRSGRPDPFFLSLEHYGTRYARRTAPEGITYGDAPLMEIAHAALQSSADRSPDGWSDLFHQSTDGLNALVRERDDFASELFALRRSRSGLFKALLAAIRHKRPR